MNRLKHVTKCRICGSELTKIVDLEEQYLQGSFCHPDKEEPPHRKVPLELMWCDTTKTEDACGAVQLSKTTPPNILYNDYWYKSSVTQTMRDHLKSVVDVALSTFNGDKERPYVLDIAANDGTLLSYYPKEYNRYAVDPSNIVETIEDKTINIIRDFFPTDKLHRNFDIITSIAVLYDLDNPLEFIRGIYDKLNNNGIWIFEMSYLPTMLEMNAFDTICGEHIFYYSLSVIEYMLDLCNMKLIDATLNDINGGSVQCIAVKKINNSYTTNDGNLKKLRLLEFEIALDDIKPYRDFKYKIDNTCLNLLTIIQDIVLYKHKTIHLYGASTKVNTLLQIVGITNEYVEYASERSPNKWGAHTLGTNIKIVSEEESRAMKPDYYLVGPWHFKEEILEREKEIIASGTKFIFPLPELTII